LTELVTELTDHQRRLELLATGGDARAEVTAVFSWSVRHLPRDAARTFRLLSLHPGPEFDAYAIAALAGISLRDAQRDLDRLARAHLVRPAGRGRHSMHDLLRAYATRQMIERTPVVNGQAALGRLFDYYLATAAAAMDRLHPAESHRRPRISPAGSPVPTLADHHAARVWLDTELPTLVAVAARAAHGSPGHAIMLSSTLYRYLDGHYPEALAVHGQAHDAARQTGDQVGQAQAQLGLGNVHMRLFHHEPATDHLTQALALFRQADEPIGCARALGSLGSVERHVGRYEAAADYLSQAATLFRQGGDHIGVAHVLNALGTLKRRTGRDNAAAGYLSQAVALFRQAGDQSGLADALSNLAIVQQRMGEYAAAAGHLGQALVLNRRFGNRRGEAHVLDNLGILHNRRHEPDRATECFQHALLLFRDVGDRDGETWVLNGLGEAAHTLGRPEDAFTHHRDAHAIAVGTGDREQQARAHAGLGRAHHGLGRLAHAREHYQQALAIYTSLGSSDATDVRRQLASLADVSVDRRRDLNQRR
jgi:tetratricopeptide (TPR) repeat protein